MRRNLAHSHPGDSTTIRPYVYRYLSQIKGQLIPSGCLIPDEAMILWVCHRIGLPIPFIPEERSLHCARFCAHHWHPGGREERVVDC